MLNVVLYLFCTVENWKGFLKSIGIEVNVVFTCTKRVLSIICIAILLVCEPFLLVAAQEENMWEDFSFVVFLDQAAITGYSGSAIDLIVPDMLGGYPVTRICTSAFCGCETLQTVTIPSSVISIGEPIPDEHGYVHPFSDPKHLCGTMILRTMKSRAVFADCPKLTDIYLPQNIETIYRDTFYHCRANLHYEAGSLTEQALITASEQPTPLPRPMPTRTPKANLATPIPDASITGIWLHWWVEQNVFLKRNTHLIVRGSPIFTLRVIRAVNVPDTGDHSRLMLWMLTAVLSIAVITLRSCKRRIE